MPLLLAKTKKYVLFAAVGFERLSLLLWCLSVENGGATATLDR